MIIPIRPPSDITLQNQCGDSIENVEWVMIELNGELLKPLDYGNETTSCTTKNGDDEHGSSHKSSDRLELGSVKFDSAGAPTLIIGHHQLKGTSITLKEPFAVLRKRKFKPDVTNEREVALLKRHSNGGAKVQYEVAGVVKKKLMFDQYPKSIMR